MPSPEFRGFEPKLTNELKEQYDHDDSDLGQVSSPSPRFDGSLKRT